MLPACFLHAFVQFASYKGYTVRFCWWSKRRNEYKIEYMQKKNGHEEEKTKRRNNCCAFLPADKPQKGGVYVKKCKAKKKIII